MMVNDGFKGGRNDDHENVNRNSETPQKLFGTSGLLTFILAKYTLAKSGLLNLFHRLDWTPESRVWTLESSLASGPILFAAVSQ